jgi:hydroxymethylpyrimidine pyrophosphatase-like HAD family hydrolase
MGIKFVFNDIDGCLGAFSKPKYPDKQDLKYHLSSFEELRSVCQKMPEVKFGVATGRSIHESDNIIHLLNFTGYSICEMGNVIYSSEKGGYLLYKNIDVSEGCRKGIDKFIRWLGCVDLDNLSKQRFPNTGIYMLKDRVCMLTFEFQKSIGNELVKWLYRFFIDDDIKDCIQQRHVKVVVSPNAVDIMPFLDKATALDHLADRYGIVLEQTLGIGDSYHSDYGFMKKCGFAACPDNSDAKLKEMVRSKKEKGYVSDKVFIDGNIDIINHSFQRWR